MRTATTPRTCGAIPCSRWRSTVHRQTGSCVRSPPSRVWRTCRTCDRFCGWGGRWSTSTARPFGRCPSGSCSTLMTPSTPCTAASSCGCSMPTTTNTGSSPSSCSRARAASSPPFCVPPSARRAPKSAPSYTGCSGPSGPTGRTRRSCCAPTAIIAARRSSTGVAPTRSTSSLGSRRPRPCAVISSAWNPARWRATLPPRTRARCAVTRSSTTAPRAGAGSSTSSPGLRPGPRGQTPASSSRACRPEAPACSMRTCIAGAVRRRTTSRRGRRTWLPIGPPAPGHAIRAAQALKPTWSNAQNLPEQTRLWEHVRATKVTKDDVTSNVGDVDQALPGAAMTLKATYDFAIHTHGSIGPSCAIAEIKDGKLTCWTASQMTHNLRKQLAAMMRMPDADVRCIYLEGSGCYGRNGHEDAAADAALLARAVGRPVRVQWSRADEHGWDPKGPPTLIDMQAGLDAKGDVVAWKSEFFIPEGAAGNVPLVAAELAGLPHETALAPGNIIQNSALPYTLPNIRTTCHRLANTPFRPSWIRTPGRMQNTYANESFLDELAAEAGVDPLDFRLRYL